MYAERVRCAHLHRNEYSRYMRLAVRRTPPETNVDRGANSLIILFEKEESCFEPFLSVRLPLVVPHMVQLKVLMVFRFFVQLNFCQKIPPKSVLTMVSCNGQVTDH